MSAAPSGTATAPPTTLLVDFGGVLTTSVARALGGLCADLGVNRRAALTALATDAATRQALIDLETGTIDDHDFERALAAALSTPEHPVAAEGLLAGIARHLDLEPEMIDLLHRARVAGVPVALVSNSLGSDTYAKVDLDTLVDVAVISADVGVRKPSRRIYEIACERLGVSPEDCLLLDDLQQNLDGAARLGIRGLLHERPEATVAAVTDLLGLPEPAPLTTPGGSVPPDPEAGQHA